VRARWWTKTIVFVTRGSCRPETPSATGFPRENLQDRVGAVEGGSCLSMTSYRGGMKGVGVDIDGDLGVCDEEAGRATRVLLGVRGRRRLVRKLDSMHTKIHTAVLGTRRVERSSSVHPNAYGLGSECPRSDHRSLS